jgi:dTDP-4-dehydrorhamnose reductase
MSGRVRTVVVVGAAGQLGSDLMRAWPARYAGDRLVGLTHADLDVRELDSVRRALISIEPELVVNTTAYNWVDAAETDPGGAFEVNAIGPRNLALSARELDAALVHVSTDYVFSGSGRRQYVETDPVDPLNVYGVSKAAGEMLVRAVWPKHFVVRTSGLYGVAGSGGKGGNFVDTMLRMARAGQAIRVVDDQFLTPTHTADLADQIATLAASGEYGTYHATCQGECSWYEFAREIFRRAGLTPSLERQTTAEAGRAAPRPPYCVLENRRLRQLGIDVLPSWDEALARYLAVDAAAVRSRG